MIHLLAHALALLVAGWCVYLPGRCLDRAWFSSPGTPGNESFFARWVLGFSFWTAALLLAASVGLYGPHTLIPLLCLIAIFWHLVALRQRSTLGEGESSAFRGPRPWPPRVLLATLLAAALVPLFAIAINPTMSWDASVYHLTLPKIYLGHGGFQPVELSVYSHWPHAVQLFYGAAMAFSSHVLAKALHFGFGLLIVASFWRRELLGDRGLLEGALASGFFLLNGVVLFEIKVAYIDLAHAFFLLAGCVLALRAARSDGEAKAFLVAGLAAGLLAGVKITGLVSAAFVGLLLLPFWLRTLRAGDTARALGSAAFFTLPVLAFAAPWWIKAWLHTGNPVYPWAHSLLGGPDWSPTLAEKLSAWQRDGIGMGREPLDYLLLPFRVIFQGGEGYDRFDGEIGFFWIVALPLALWAARRGELSARLVVVAGLHALWWGASSQQMRFLIPTLAVLAPPAARGASSLIAALTRGSAVRQRAAVLALTLSASLWFAGFHGRLYASGLQHLKLYLRPNFEPLAEIPREPIFDDIDRLPESAKILLLNTNRTFHCSRTCVADSFFEASQISDWLRSASSPREVYRALRERGITHLLLDRRPLGASPYPASLLQLLGDPRFLRPAAERGRFLLLAIEPPRALPQGLEGEPRLSASPHSSPFGLSPRPR
ncbi:MAG: hypothetical protein AAF725_00655 [Acidobacteriota bacterium]